MSVNAHFFQFNIPNNYDQMYTIFWERFFTSEDISAIQYL